jgi:predicted RNA-binding protein with RPS1 domain
VKAIYDRGQEISAMINDSDEGNGKDFSLSTRVLENHPRNVRKHGGSDGICSSPEANALPCKLFW